MLYYYEDNRVVDISMKYILLFISHKNILLKSFRKKFNVEIFQLFIL